MKNTLTQSGNLLDIILGVSKDVPNNFQNLRFRFESKKLENYDNVLYTLIDKEKIYRNIKDVIRQSELSLSLNNNSDVTTLKFGEYTSIIIIGDLRDCNNFIYSNNILTGNQFNFEVFKKLTNKIYKQRRDIYA